MWLRLAVLLGAWLAVVAQTTLTVEQLMSFVRSSIQLRHEDRKVAQFLRKVKLSEKLDERTIEELQTLAVGPKTLEALHELRDASQNLPDPPKPVRNPVPVQIPGPSPEEQKRIIEEVRRYALSYTRRLPDFICTQVTRRYADPSGLEFWQSQDVITTRLSYFEQKEDYKVVLVNNQVMTNVSYDALGGATSTGEFGSMLREIFEPETRTQFAWERWATLRGHRVHVFSYRVAQPQSRWRISYQKVEQITPAYRGLVYVDRDTLEVLRVTLEAEDIPPSFPIQRATTVLDYDLAEVGDHRYMLPLKAVVRMREGKFLVKNEVEFRMYRKFSAEATITFDTPPPLPEEKLKEEPPKP